MSGLLSVVLAAFSLAACGGGSSLPTSPAAAARGVQGCNLYQSVGRSTQSNRSTQGSDCSDGGQDTSWDTPSGDPGFTWDSSFGDSFYGAQDNWGNLCSGSSGGYAVIGCTHSRNINPFYSPIAYVSPPLPPIQVVTPGAGANRGDNCSNTNGLAVGFPIPGGAQNSIDGNTLGSANNSATISNQSQIVVTAPAPIGIQVIGFLIGTKGDGYFFVPAVVVGISPPFTSFSQTNAGIYPLPSPNVNSPADIAAINAAYQDFAQRYNAAMQNWLVQALAAAVPKLGLDSCYTSALPRNG